MSTPAARVRTIVPGKRALTSSRAGVPSVARRACTLTTPVALDGLGHRPAERHEVVVGDGAPGDGDAGVDLVPAAWDRCDDVAVGSGEDVDRELVAGQVLLQDVGLVAGWQERDVRGVVDR